MKYFRLMNASSRKEVGFQFQTNGFIEGYDIDGPNSRTNQENRLLKCVNFIKICLLRYANSVILFEIEKTK